MTLLEKIKPEIDKHKIISFDIFDTLLLRPYVKPTDLFEHLSRIENVNNFKELRIKAEQTARTKHKDFEDITIDQIYAEMPKNLSYLKAKEMDFERKVLQPNLEMKEVFDYAKSQNKRIIIVSDMYLSIEFLSIILQEKGFSGFEKLYVSCQENKTKWTGNLYKFILKDLNVKGSFIFHIGDNNNADKIKAEKNKISAFLYTRRIDKLFEDNERAKQFYEKNKDNLDVSIILGMLTLNDIENNYWQDFGYKYAGPVILGYMQWLEKQLIKDKIKEVMFVARDGYTLEKVFNLIKKSDFSTHYFYAPRNLNLACNLNYEHNCALGEMTGILGLNTILHYYKNKDVYLKKNTPEIKTSAEGIKFIEDNRKLFESLAQKEKNMYSHYFDKFNLHGSKLALVDTCSTLLSAQKALIAALPEKQVSGYYWFTWEGTQNDIKKYRTKTYQISHKQEFVDWNIMELFMTAPTPPVERIDSGKVIFKEITPNEARRMEIYPDLSKGAVIFAQKYKDVFGEKSIELASEHLIDWINILCNIPTQIDKEHFISIQHAWNEEHTLWQPLPKPWFAPKQSNCEPLKNIKRFYFLGIPLFKIKQSVYRWNFKLFHFISLVSYKNKIDRKCFYLLGFPIYQIKQKANKTTYSLFKVLPIISIKRK